MSGETARQESGWTLDTWIYHDERMRDLDNRLQAERDRRYKEVNIEKEKALKIKETADLAALGLAREIQTYKDEKANQLREQINSERGIYVTQIQFKPISDYVQSQTGKANGLNAGWAYLLGFMGLVSIVAGLVLAIKN